MVRAEEGRRRVNESENESELVIWRYIIARGHLGDGGQKKCRKRERKDIRVFGVYTFRRQVPRFILRAWTFPWSLHRLFPWLVELVQTGCE